ncbi:hypothetical protein P9112_000362 [Eukaryota sp. TZLM1-RC]
MSTHHYETRSRSGSIAPVEEDKQLIFTPKLFLTIFAVTAFSLPIFKLTGLSISISVWSTLLFSSLALFLGRVILSDSISRFTNRRPSSFIMYLFVSVSLTTLFFFICVKTFSPFIQPIHSSPDVTNLTNRVDTVDKTVMELSSEVGRFRGELNEILVNISEINQDYVDERISKLENLVNEIKNVVDKHETRLSETLGNLRLNQTVIESIISDNIDPLSEILANQSKIIDDLKARHVNVNQTILSEFSESIKKSITSELSTKVKPLFDPFEFPNILVPSTLVTINTRESSPSFKPSSLLLRVVGQNVPQINRILSDQIYPGQCWPFKGNKGHVTVELNAEYLVRFIGLDHTSRENLVDFRTSPKLFSVICQSPHHFELVSGIYDLEGQSEQNFKVSIPRMCKKILFKFDDNYGGDYTCIYRIRAHVERK